MVYIGLTARDPLGIAFAIWARETLGRLWSGTITLKQDHRVVRTGPYALARHPIYTGILTGVLGVVVARAALELASVVSTRRWHAAQDRDRGTPADLQPRRRVRAVSSRGESDHSVRVVVPRWISVARARSRDACRVPSRGRPRPAKPDLAQPRRERRRLERRPYGASPPRGGEGAMRNCEAGALVELGALDSNSSSGPLSTSSTIASYVACAPAIMPATSPSITRDAEDPRVACPQARAVNDAIPAHDGRHDLDDVDLRRGCAVEDRTQREAEAEPADQDARGARLADQRTRATSELVLGGVVVAVHQLDTADTDRKLIAAARQRHLATGRDDALDDNVRDHYARP